MQRVYLNVPFNEKDCAKRLGAKWDNDAKLWYAETKQKLKQLDKWTIKTVIKEDTTSLVCLGAIHKLSGKYVSPLHADKRELYMCPVCHKDVVPKQGNILRHHFAHKRSDDPCQYYTHPSEAQIHKDAKMCLKQMLENGRKITTARTCPFCKECEEFDIPEFVVGGTSSIVSEYGFRFGADHGRKVADVAYVDGGDIVCIFEILNTHKTEEENRPEPWFEINAVDMVRLANTDTVGNELKIPCVLPCVRQACEKWKCKNMVMKLKTADNNKSSRAFTDYINSRAFYDDNDDNVCDICQNHPEGMYLGDDCYIECFMCGNG